MSRSRGHFEEFKPHSKHKHLILEQYFYAWGHKLGLREGAGNAILYVDACAGRGADDLGNDGSPLIAARAAALAQENVGGRRGDTFRIHVVAIEVNRDHHAALAERLAPFGDTVRALRGTLEDHINDLEREFPETPALYFIDPFGLEPLQSALVRRAISGKSHEALLLFADQAALRHFGAIVADETRAERRHRTASDSLTLFPDLEPDRLASLAHAASESREQLDLTRANAVRILNAAFGDEHWLPEIEAMARGDRRAAFLSLYSERLKRWGATHVLQIPIVDETGARAYTLIHACKSPKAYTAMKEAVTYALKDEKSPLPEVVVARMKRLVQSDLSVAERAVLRRFRSSQARWAEDPNIRNAPSVRRFLLEDTTVYPFELPELKERLKRLRLPGKSIVYSFPGELNDVDQD